MRVLYIGDIFAQPGAEVVAKLLPEIKKTYSIDLTIAQAENLSENGKGITPADFKNIRRAGVDFCTGGNWSLFHDEIISSMNNPEEPIIRPANYPASTPGLGWKYIETAKGKALVISLLGNVVGRDANKPTDNPLKVIDSILESQSDVPKVATVVNFHGDYSSEKLVIGQYLDGRVSAVIGDHWHITTADAMVLPGGTAHITDIGMCGTLNSSLGVKTETIISRWRDGRVTRNEVETSGPMQFNGLLFEVDEATGLSKNAELIRRII